MNELEQMTDEEFYNYLKEKFIKKYKRKLRKIKRKISKCKEKLKISKYGINYDKEYRNYYKKSCFDFRKDKIKIIFPLKEFWDDIKYSIPKTITSLEVPFELIKDDLIFLKELPNLKKLIINDELNEEKIKLLYDNTNIREVYTNHLYEYYDYYYKKEYSIAKIDGTITIIAYKDLLIKNSNTILQKEKNSNKQILDSETLSAEINCKKKELIIQSYDLDENRIKKILKLIDINNISKITIDIYSKNYFCTDFSYFYNLSKQVDLKFKYDRYIETDTESFKNYAESLRWYKNIINEANLSPIEKVMFAYDIMKTFKYKEDNCDKKSSRQPHKIIETGNIVCVGYSRLLKEILNDIDENIKVGNFGVFCYDKNNKPLGGHERNIIQIDDEKYDIHGMFTLDATWDSVRSKEKDNLDIEYTALDLYRYFLIPTCDYIEKFPNDTIPSIFCDYLNIPRKNNKKYTLVDCYIFCFEEFLNDKNIKITKEKINEYLNGKGLSKETFNEILYNVRIAEGFTKEQAIKEIEKVGRINKKVKSVKVLEETYSQEKKLTKKKEI